jgi:hypothetical protein
MPAFDRLLVAIPGHLWAVLEVDAQDGTNYVYSD